MKWLMGVCLVFLGCGAPPYGGNWGGLLHRQISCDDHSTAEANDEVDLSIHDNDDWTIEVVTSGKCGTFVADVSRTQATLRGKGCGTTPIQGVTWDDTMSSGWLKRSDKKIQWSSEMISIGRASNRPTCHIIDSGDLFTK